jgi:hypothetical protein
VGCTFQGELEREVEEAHFPRKFELKEREQQQGGLARIPRRGLAHIPRRKFNI